MKHMVRGKDIPLWCSDCPVSSACAVRTELHGVFPTPVDAEECPLLQLLKDRGVYKMHSRTPHLPSLSEGSKAA